eukprot:gene6694-10859_t
MYPFDLIPGPLYIFVILGGIIICILAITGVIALQIMYDRARNKMNKPKKPRHDGIGMNLGIELDSDYGHEHHHDVNSPVLFEPDDFNQQNNKNIQETSQFSEFI